MNYTDKQLKAALAKMLRKQTKLANFFWHLDEDGCFTRQIEDTELLHLCWLVEETLDWNQHNAFQEKLKKFITKQTTFWLCSMPWQNRTIALAKVKGIKI